MTYEDEQLTLKQLVAFLRLSLEKTIEVLDAHDVEIHLDADDLENEIAHATYEPKPLR